MTLSTLAIHTLTVSRQTATNAQKSAYASVGSISCFIQPLDDTVEVSQGQAFGRQFQAYMERGSNIQVGDKAVDGSGREYRVSGLKDYDYSMGLKHMQVLLTEEVTV